MRRARITYPGAFHHVMNRGYNGNDIFCGKENKNQFLDYLADTSKKLKIRILAYCIMDTHYHLVLENSSGRLSEFQKLLNGLYGSYYRMKNGGQGYVFQNRFKSTLIEKDSYLLKSIVYLLMNPVRAGIVHTAESYVWSSVNAYYSTGPIEKNDKIVDVDFVNELFGGKSGLKSALYSESEIELPIKTTKYGEVLGCEDFVKSSIEKHDRRKIPTHQGGGMQRIDDRYFDCAEKVIMEFESIYRVDVEAIDTTTYEGKRLRGELLILLKEKGGLTYKEISRIDIFCELSMNSLPRIYRNAKEKKSG